MKSRFMLLLLLLLAGAMSAQTFRGTILGTVTDLSGAVVPGAKVTVLQVATGIERTTQTSPDGSYNLPELPIGTYTVSVSASGFQTAVTKDVVVDVASDRRVDAQLKTGQVSEVVEVSGETLPQVETTSAELGGILTTKTIENLPVNGRDYTKLIYLNPGVSGSPDQISDSPGSFGTFSMNGSRGRSNNFLLDGTDMNDGFRNDPAINEAGVFGDPATILPIDAVAELRVLSNYEAEYGRNSGAVVNIVTKSGTNQFHGSGLEFLRTGQMGARNFFNNVGGKNPFHNNQFGGALGGPIAKNRTFFYLDYEGQRESGAQSGLSCVPDPKQIAADITANGAPNPVIAALLKRNPWPAPNLAAPSDDSGCTNGGNLSTATRFKNRVDSVIAKIDHNFDSNDLLTGRYYFGDSDQSFPFAQLAGGLLPGFNTVTPTRVQLISLSYVKIVNPQQVNEARLGWNRFAEGFFPEDNKFNPSSIGLNTGVGAFDYGLPHISVASFSVIGATASVPRNRVDANWHFIDNYTWKAGKNDIKFGYEYRRTTIKLFQDSNFRGKLSFADLPSFLAGTPDVGSGSKQAQGYTGRHSLENNHSFYFQDSFRATAHLTLNFGARWDYFGVVSERNNLFYRYDATNDAVVQIGTAGTSSQLYQPDYNNFAPRVAFAYDIGGHGKTVVRGGWGLFYDAFSQDIFLGHIPYNCTFCPGPAYAGIGPSAISFAGVVPSATDPAVGVALAPNSPVYANPSPLGDFFGVDPNIRTPYVQNFNLNLQRQVSGKAVVQVGYVGAKGTKLFRFRDVNQPSQATITAADLACNCILGFDAGSNAPRSSANFFYLNQEESTATSIYHSLQGSLRLSGFHGLTSQLNYVYSHSIDNASDSEDFIPNAAQPNNSLAPKLDRGNSNFDIRNRFSWNFNYEFPNNKGNHARLTDGWGLDGVLNLQDGQPFSFNYNFEGDYSGSGEGFDRPDIVGPIHYGSAPFNFIDLTSFQVPCTFGVAGITSSGDSSCIPGTRHFGNLGRNSLRGPSFKEFNASIFKNTPLSEHVTLQLRAEFFNVFNHPNFANPELPNFIADPAVNGLDSVGRGTGAYALTATGDVGIGNPFLGGGGPRGMQFAAKISF
ncbi:MAG TPA: TonB-dependent receptor [Terriglobales bacterium]|nr:TonB-dependent receptor [Terriglobales bacterium]